MSPDTNRRAFLRYSAAAGVAMVAGCTGDATDDNDGQYEAAFSVPSLEFTFFARMENAFEAVREERSDLSGSFYDAQNSQSQQVSDLETAISNEVDFIMVSPITAEGISPVVQEANEANIPVVTIDRNVAEGDIATYVASDNVSLGRRSMELCYEFMQAAEDRSEYNVVELQGTQGASVTNDREEGGAEAIDERDDVTLIDSQTGEFSTSDAVSVMEDFITSHGDDIHGVYAHNDLMALGAHQALEGSDLENVAITGIDGSEAWVDMFDRSEYYGTIAQLPEEMVRQATDSGVKAVEGKELDDYYPVEGLEVISDNAEEYLGEYF